MYTVKYMATLLSNAKALAKRPSRERSGHVGRGRGRTAPGVPLPSHVGQTYYNKYTLVSCEARRGGSEQGSVSWNSVTNEEVRDSDAVSITRARVPLS